MSEPNITQIQFSLLKAKIKRIDINPKYNYGDVFTFEDGQTIEIRSEENGQKEEA